MMDFQTIHEGFFKKIFDLIDKSDLNQAISKKLGAKTSDNDNANKFVLKGNIAKAVSGLTLTFPFLVTEATKLDSAMMASKAIERKAVLMLQMLFAANQISDVRTAEGYLQQFHHNLDQTKVDYSDIDVDDVINLSDKIAQDGNLSESAEYKDAVSKIITSILEDNKKNTNYVLSTDINPVSINEYTVDLSLNEMRFSNKSTDTTTDKSTKTTISYDKGNSTETHVSTIEKTSDANTATQLKNAYDMLNKQVLKTDIDKANELAPSMMIVNFITEKEQGNNIITTFIIGVKSQLHYVSSKDMIDRILLKNSDKRGLLNLVRATTREISFFRDFLFAVDRAKIDAIAKAGKGSTDKAWKLLELRANRSRLNSAAGKSDDAAAITTLCITMEEASILKQDYRIDVTRPNVMLSIMRGYNLMCAIILDDITERAMFLYDDGSSQYETVSYMGLERESNYENKKVINLLAKSR